MQRISAFRSARAVCLLLGIAAVGHAIDVTAKLQDTALQKDFIANATTYYTGTVTPSTVFPGNYVFTVTGKRQVAPPPPPPPPSNPIPDGTAFDRCFVHGWVFGSENERTDVVNLIRGAQYDIFKSTSCGGTVANPASTPAQAYLDGCSQGYNVAVSTINLRNGMEPPVLVPPFPPLP